MSASKGDGRGHPSEWAGPVVGGLFAAAGLFATVIGVGRIGSFEALRSIEAAVPAARFLASAAIGSAMTVLALLLTLLGLSLGSRFEFDARLFRQARHIRVMSVATLVLSSAILVAAAIPLEEVDGLERYYQVFYYSLTSSLSLLGGLLVAIGLMIGATLRGLSIIGRPIPESGYLRDDGQDEKQESRSSADDGSPPS